MNRFNRIYTLRRMASALGQKATGGANYTNPGTFSDEEIKLVEAIKLRDEFGNKASKPEKQFLEIGAALTTLIDYVNNQVFEYISVKRLNPGYIEEQYRWYPKGSTEKFINKNEILSQFNKLVGDVIAYNKKLEQEAEEAKKAEYKTDVVEHRFDDGWRVVYLPAAGEVEPFPGYPDSSWDRVVEGNKNGLCLGTGNGKPLYQDNSRGKIYSIRNQKNEPKVTITINEKALVEAKGKFNNPPDIEGAKHAKEWFKSLGLDSSYENHRDYKNFPPTEIEEAKAMWEADKGAFLKKPWAFHWYGKGLGEFDETINSSTDVMMLLNSGIISKYPDRFELLVTSYLQNEPRSVLTLTSNLTTSLAKIYKSKDWMQNIIRHIIANSYLKPTELYVVSDVSKELLIEYYTRVLQIENFEVMRHDEYFLLSDDYGLKDLANQYYQRKLQNPNFYVSRSLVEKLIERGLKEELKQYYISRMQLGLSITSIEVLEQVGITKDDAAKFYRNKERGLTFQELDTVESLGLNDVIAKDFTQKLSDESFIINERELGTLFELGLNDLLKEHIIKKSNKSINDLLQGEIYLLLRTGERELYHQLLAKKDLEGWRWRSFYFNIADALEDNLPNLVSYYIKEMLKVKPLYFLNDIIKRTDAPTLIEYLSRSFGNDILAAIENGASSGEKDKWRIIFEEFEPTLYVDVERLNFINQQLSSEKYPTTPSQAVTPMANQQGFSNQANVESKYYLDNKLLKLAHSLESLQLKKESAIVTRLIKKIKKD